MTPERFRRGRHTQPNVSWFYGIAEKEVGKMITLTSGWKMTLLANPASAAPARLCQHMGLTVS